MSRLMSYFPKQNMRVLFLNLVGTLQSFGEFFFFNILKPGVRSQKLGHQDSGDVRLIPTVL